MRTQGQRRSRLQERRIANEVGGRVQAGSGSSWRAKSDVRAIHNLRVEAKHTTKRTFPLKLKDIIKIRDEALIGGLEPWAMQVEFVESASMSTKVAVISRHHFGSLATDWFGIRDSTTRGQFPLHRSEIMTHKHVASTVKYGYPWMMHLTFQRLPKASDFEVAICDWDWFVERHKERS